MITNTELKSIERTINNRFDYLRQKADNIQSNIEWTERAIEHFGTTTDPIKAGYILYNGEMLDFSGDAKDITIYDHANIGLIYTEEELSIPKFKNVYGGFNATPFQIESNSIRMYLSKHNELFISLYDTQKITKEQIKTLTYIEDNYELKNINYDIFDKDTNPIKYNKYVKSVKILLNELINYVQQN